MRKEPGSPARGSALPPNDGGSSHGDKPFVVDVNGKLVYSEMRCVLDAARQGLGLAYVFRQFAEEHIRSGQLVPLLERHCAASESFYLYYPSRAQMPGKLRASIELMQTTIRTSDKA